MKSYLFTALVLLTVAARAATLEAALPAFAAPDAKAPILGTAKAGTKLATVAAPAGWVAVELVGPHTVYVTEKDTLKNFEVRPAGAYHSAPRADAPVVGLAGEKDPAEFVDIVGRYNKFILKKPLIAYVRATPTPAAAAVAPAGPAAAAAAPALMGDLNATLRNDIPASSPAATGQSAQLGEPRLARTFYGTVASTRNPLRPRRPYDFQINDSAGARIAYIDISRLLLTEQIEAFIGRPVYILGTAEPLGSSNEIVIRCETLKLQ